MKEIGRMLGSAAAAAVLFLVLFFALDLHFLFAAACALAAYFGFYLVFKPSHRIAGVDIEDLAGGEEIRKMLEEAEQDLRAIRQDTEKISDTGVRTEAEKLYETGSRILGYLGKNPQKIRLARHFFTYYLDTAERLLARYVEFQNTGLTSGEVNEILDKTRESLPRLNEAFDQQFTHLMEGELMDVDADIRLLNSTLTMEGDHRK